MFKFLKDKLKDAVGRITEKIKETPEEEKQIYEIKKSKISGEGTFATQKIKKGQEIGLAFEKIDTTGTPDKDYKRTELGTKTNHAESANGEIIQKEKEFYLKSTKEIKEGEEILIDYKTIPWEGKTEFKETKKESFLTKLKTTVTTTKVTETQFDELFWELELTLLESNVAVEVIEKLKEDLKKAIVNQNLKRKDIETTIQKTLKESIEEILTQPERDLIKEIKKKKPYVICFVGVNGTGKTTTIGKVAYYLKEMGMTSVMVAADTFRAAAIEQLEEWGKKTQTKVIKHDYGSDPAAVAFDGIEHAKAKGINVVLIDTAGRLHSNKDLMSELQKIIRIAKPDLKIFVGEATTGNDVVTQIKQFNETIGIDGTILTKLDVDEKGGAALSTSFVTKKPIFFIGIGQSQKALKPFDKDLILKNLGLK